MNGLSREPCLKRYGTERALERADALVLYVSRRYLPSLPYSPNLTLTLPKVPYLTLLVNLLRPASTPITCHRARDLPR